MDDLVPLTAETYVTLFLLRTTCTSMDEEVRASQDEQCVDVQQHISLFQDVRLIELYGVKPGSQLPDW